MREPEVFVDGDTLVEHAIRELQDLAVLHRQHIERIDRRLDAMDEEARQTTGRTDDRISSIRKEVDRLKGVHGA